MSGRRETDCKGNLKRKKTKSNGQSYSVVWCAFSIEHMSKAKRNRKKADETREEKQTSEETRDENGQKSLATQRVLLMTTLRKQSA